MSTTASITIPRALSGAEVEQLDPYAFFAVLGKRVIHPGGRRATPAGFLHDEGLANAMAVLARSMSRLCYLRKMLWLMPRVARAVPYLGYILVSGSRPADGES